MTDEELAEIRARCEAALPGPWAIYNYGNGPDEWFVGTAATNPRWKDEPDRDVTTHAEPAESSGMNKADAEFIAHARTDVPALLAEIEQLRGLIGPLTSDHELLRYEKRMNGVQLVVRPITVEDQLFWNRRGEKTRIVSMRGDHIGAENIEVLRNDRGPGDFQHCWRVPYVVPGDDETTYWFTMFCEGFPPVAAIAQMP